MKETDRIFKAVFAASNFNDIENFKLHCKIIEDIKNEVISKIGAKTQWKSFRKHYVIKDYSDIIKDFENFL